MTDQKGIIRAQKSKDRPYFSMARATAQDRAISFEARGMLAYFLSKPDNWQVLISDLCQECGKNRVYRIIKELRESGYMERIYQRDDKGKITAVDYVVYEVKHPFPQNQEMENQEMENPFVDNQPLHNIENTEKREETKKRDKPRAARSRLSFTPRQYTPSKAASPRIYQIVKHWVALNNPASFYADETEKPAQALLDAGYAVETITAILDWKASQQYLPTLKKTCTEIGAWIKEYERRAKSKPATVPANGTTAALTPIIPDVMDGHIEITAPQYESEF